METTNSYALFDDFGDEPDVTGTVKEETLPVCDGGYFDALVAIGLAALVDAYTDTGEESPLIQWTPNGFRVRYKAVKERVSPRLSWLRYSVAGAWRKGEPETWKAPTGYTKKSPGWDDTPLIKTDGAEVDVSQNPQKTIVLDNGERKNITDPMRQLYGVANKLGSPEWFNLCVYSCQKRGKELIDGSFQDKTISLNSMVLPQASKGASGSASFSIANKSLPEAISLPLSRFTCLAIAGFILSATGQAPQKSVQGFAVPVPKQMRLATIRSIAQANHDRLTNGGFFFNYDNYLSLIRLLLLQKEREGYPDDETSLFSVAGASFVPLGNSSSPSGSWQLAVPRHHYSTDSIYRLQQLLRRWKKACEAGQDKTVSVDRAAVAKLMRGFECSKPNEATEGYLAYIADTGLVGRNGGIFYPLTQQFFEEIMAYKYQKLLQEFQKGGKLRSFVDLIRRETYTAVNKPGQTAKAQPNYQMIRGLREVQNVEDFIRVVTEIAIERGVTKLATASNANSRAQSWQYPQEEALIRLIELVETNESDNTCEPKYSPKLLSNLILSFALAKRPDERTSDEGKDSEDDAQEEDIND